ncbi:MAG: hypothetical protein ISR65_01585, partial [Bacteriovoracaceae bacterium]|nr:hypothetical protein [Bacteriovoracaceae bacterium]
MKLSNIIAYLISFICIYSCMNSEQVHITLAPEAKDKLQYWKDDDKGVPEVDSFELKNGIATVKGRNLRDVRRAQIVGPSLNTDFTILEQDHDYLTLTGRNSLQIVAEYTYNLILSNAFGQGSTPILFTIEDESIRNRMFPDGEIAGS